MNTRMVVDMAAFLTICWGGLYAVIPMVFVYIVLKLRRIEKMTATKADLDAALAAFKTNLAAQIALVKVMAGLKRLEDIIAAGGNPVDLQAEIDSLKADVTEIGTMGAKADTEGVPPPPPTA